MISKSKFRAVSICLFVIGQVTLAGVAEALVPKREDGALEPLTFVSEILQASPQSEAFDEDGVTAAAGIASTWESFRVMHGGWSAIVDKRTGKIESAEGTGIPFVPGRGNQLQTADLGNGRDIDLALMEAITRAFLPSVADLLGVDPSDLALNQGRSGHPAEYLWFVDFDVILDGMNIEGARVVFRVNNGNLIQFGSENLPAEGIEIPKVKVARNQALSILATYVGGFSAADAFIDGGSQHLIPVALIDGKFAEGFEPGKGRGLARVWQFVFRRDGDYGTWRARVDATTGKLLEFRDLNDYASAQVAGGVTSLNGVENRPMPFSDISSGGYTNSAGVYNYTSGTVSSTLNGQYVRISDSCGAISLSSDASGNLAFGTSNGTDCETPGYGGPGNTNAARTQFYHLNRAKEIARGWLNLPWLTSQTTANVNLPDGVCNAFWDGATINFIRRGTGCSNSGEIQGVGLHEFGHGMDANDGNGPSPDKGTGETYGDWTSALITHDSCIGSGLLTSNCDGFGDPCTSCTGVRDIDYTKHSSNTPHTVGNFTQVLCPVGNGYNGPCGREGHCESQVSSEALWDLVSRDLPNLGLSSDSAWALMERLWYLSRPTATAAFTCFKATSPWTSDGCGTGSLWKTLRAVDDDDGNLLNGTPHSAALYAAFDRHGIACTSDAGAATSFRGCTQQLAPPSLSLAASNNQVTLSWSGSSGVYDVYRNEQGCNAGGFIKVANDLATSPFTDSGVANDFTYFYKVVAHSSSSEACPLAPSACLEASPCLPPAPPTSLTATAASANQIDLLWTDSLGATRYHIYRATNPNGPYTQIGTRSGTSFSDTSLSACKTYYYEVRAAKNEICESGNSVQVVATTTGSCLLRAYKSVGGMVASSPAGISCGADCNETYSYNTSVTLTATPATGYLFKGWSGECTGKETCTVMMTQFRLVGADFNKPKLGVGMSSFAGYPGTVTSTPAGINCVQGIECSERYDYDTLVTLVATPAEGSVFRGWSGACAGTGTCTVRMTQDINVAAAFYLPVLSVKKLGDGTVTATPAGFNLAGLNCGEGTYFCINLYPLNTLVTLTATPAAGKVFLGWGGACSGTGTCAVTMSQDLYVTVTFANPSTSTYLMASLAGTGSGTVASTPDGINCGTVCSQFYSYNTPVTLTAMPATGSVFDGWSGACTETGTCTVTMTQARSVAATFSAVTYPLSVSLAGAGSGIVTSTPAGVNCGEDCGEAYNYNTLVTLIATPTVGSMFDGWEGACTGTGVCEVTMTQARSVTATFSVGYPLMVSLAGARSGAVTSTPAGVNCGEDCREGYDYNTLVTLIATPTAGSMFNGWNGACTGTGVCEVTMTQARSVTATFSAGYPLTVSLAGAGSGTVTSAPAGINCGVDCSEEYNYDTQVTLTASPSRLPTTMSVFGGWSGAVCVGTWTCTVAITQAHSVTATFLVETHTLTASLAGAGSGIVTSTPAGINCGVDCSESYNYNTLVTLTATPAPGSVFSGWSGTSTGTGSTYTRFMTLDASLTATFSVGYPLTVSLAGAGSGAVTSTPAGINCGVDCTAAYSENTQVTLTATPTTGSVFSGWSGACTGTGTCAVTMTQARSVTATFSVATHTLTASLAGAGSGTVTSTPAGINCGVDCTVAYSENTQVTLTATPTTGSVFSGWSGACTGTGTCAVTMTQARSVTATFSVATHTLTASLAGAGSGTVTSTPAGIICWVDCSEAYNYNTQVTLTATPMTGSVFSGWSGACTGTETCAVTMTQARSVTATFSVATHTLTASLAGAGSGTVTSTPAGINCGVDCSEAYNYNTQVTLTAAPTTGSVFSGWSGACTGTGTCALTMTQARSVTAAFSVVTHTLAVSLAGAGSGTVTSTPAGINCGVDCSESYNYNTQVTLTAAPSSALLVFEGWSGACTGTGNCVVTMDQAKSVTATFDNKGQDFHTLTPCRVLDTRVTGIPLTSGIPLIINVAGACGVPATAKTVALNLTAIMAPGQGAITLYPGDVTLPDTWAISFPPLLSRTNNAVMPLAWNGNGTLAARAVISGGGSMHMALDVTGYFE